MTIELEELDALKLDLATLEIGDPLATRGYTIAHSIKVAGLGSCVMLERACALDLNDNDAAQKLIDDANQLSCEFAGIAEAVETLASEASDDRLERDVQYAKSMGLSYDHTHPADEPRMLVDQPPCDFAGIADAETLIDEPRLLADVVPEVAS